MTWHGADIGAIAAYVAGGGLAGVTVALNHFFPAHASDVNSAAIALVSIAGLVRIVMNPTPTNQVTLTDRATGSTVSVRTVNAPTPPKE